MNPANSTPISVTMAGVVQKIQSRQDEIRGWLESFEVTKELPLYSSVDIRDAGFKAAVVDTNIFPAGFNNLCEHGLADSVKFLREAILKRVVNCKNILIIAEEHTRNTWYLENIRILEDITRKAGFNVKIATFLTVQPDFCSGPKAIELETATGQNVRIHCFKRVLEDYKAGKEKYCLIILNNDLTTGIPEVLQQSSVPIYPSVKAGWHSRQKSHHFQLTAELMKEFAEFIDLDPWLLSCLFTKAGDVDINEDKDRLRLMDEANDLMKKIKAKYLEHGIDEKPYLVLKSDTGTYGMGVMAVEDPAEIRDLNRKGRNKLYKGKSSQVIDRFIIQEGVPTIYSVANKASEVCIYQIENNLIGGFYRSHSGKGSRENLNSTGMEFHKICPHSAKYGDCGHHTNWNMFDVYRILARIAAVAAHREILHLEAA